MVIIICCHCYCLLKYLELNNKLHEGQRIFAIGKSCIDNIISFNELIHGHIKVTKSTYTFFLNVNELMTLYGGMGYGIQCEKWVLKIKCGE